MRTRKKHTHITRLQAKFETPHRKSVLAPARETFLNKATHYKFKQYLNAIKNLPDIELKYLIENSDNLEQRSAAFLLLIKSGNLRDLQNLRKWVDLDYCDQDGENAVLMACIHNRADVLRWLVDDEDQSLEVSDNNGDTPLLLAIMNNHSELLHLLNTPTAESGFGLEFDTATSDMHAHPVMRTALHDHAELLHEMAKPVELGGFGLSLDVRDAHDFGLDAIAMMHNSTKVLLKLLRPINKGGLGSVIDQSNLVMHYPNHDRGFTDNHYVVYYTHADNQEALVILDTVTGNSETLHPEYHMGAGGFGSVMKFSSDNYTFAVKKPKDGWIKMHEDQADFDAYKNHKKWMSHEYKYLRLAYPNNGPYVLQQLRDVKNNLRRYSYRLIMPVIPGQELEKHLLKFRGADHLAQTLLRVAEEIQRIHNLGIIHGDIRTGNILVNPININGKEDVRVHLLDFYMAHKIGKNAPFDDSDNPYVAPERLRWDVAGHPSQDVFSLAITIQYALTEIRRLDKTIDAQIQKHFPAIKEFMKSGQSLIAADRPTLQEFIATLEDQIAAYKPAHTGAVRVAQPTKTALRANSIFDSHTWEVEERPAAAARKKNKAR